MDELLGLPAWQLATLGALAVVQIALEVYALVVLFRTPAERVVTGKRWVWVLVILLINLAGALVFLFAGRKPAPAAEPAGPEAGSESAVARAARAADVLYGPRDSERQ